MNYLHPFCHMYDKSTQHSQYVIFNIRNQPTLYPKALKYLNFAPVLQPPMHSHLSSAIATETKYRVGEKRIKLHFGSSALAYLPVLKTLSHLRATDETQCKLNFSSHQLPTGQYLNALGFIMQLSSHYFHPCKLVGR